MADTTTLIICDTCKYATEEKTHNGRTGGEHFWEHVAAAAEASPTVRVKRFSCLMNCKRFCSVAISAPGKVGYVMGDFTPTAEDAAALVDYAAKHAASETGVVPFNDWPEGVKGRFAGRIPSSGMIID